MKILILSHVLPYPLDDGTRLRIFPLIRALAEKHDVALFSVIGSEGEKAGISGLRGLCRKIETVVLPSIPKRSRREHLWHLVSSREPIAIGPRLPQIQLRIKSLIQETGFDVIQVESPQLARYVWDEPRATKVVDVHDIEYQYLDRLCATLPLPERFYRRMDARKLMKWEVDLWRFFGHCLAISEPIATVLRRQAPRARVWLVPNGVEVPPANVGEVTESVDSLVFVGDFSYKPNTDAVDYFCRDVLPLVRKKRPGVTLYAVGKNPPPSFQDLGGGKVVITGYVDDVRLHLLKAAVVVVPLRVGSGVRNKILEAWAAGKAVVATSLGAEGLAVRPGENILIADTSDRFAEDVLSLLDDPLRRRRLGESGRQTALQNYSWENCGDSLLQAYSEIEAERRRHPVQPS